MEEISRQKTELRSRILKERNALSALQRQEWDRQILEHLIRQEQEKPCTACLCYVNYKSEVSTKEFIRWCLDNGKPVFVPKVMAGGSAAPENKCRFFQKAQTEPAEMEFYRLTAWEELKTGYQGIPEPEAFPEKAFSRWLTENLPERALSRQSTEREMENSKKPGKLCLRMFLPGAVFDREENRIGYGGGFYDRWLAKWNPLNEGNPAELEKIGLAYDMQVLDTIPTESFDQRVDYLITEKFGRRADK